MARNPPEWIGATPDAKVPPRVRLRIFQRYGGRCYLSDREIRPGDAWELEHRTALILGGEHREANLAPVLPEFHKAKTAAEMKVKAKTDALAKRHVGIVDPPKMQGAPFPKTRKAARRQQVAASKLPIPRRARPMYQPKEQPHD